jgi:hypothetical protein
MMFNLFGQLAPEEKEQGVPLMLQGVPLANQEQIQEAAKMPTANLPNPKSVVMDLPQPESIEKPQYEKAIDDAYMKMMMDRQKNVEAIRSDLTAAEAQKPTAFQALNLKPLMQWADQLNGTNFSYSTPDNNRMDKYNAQLEKLKSSLNNAQEGMTNDQLNYLKIRLQEDAADKRLQATLKSQERQAARQGSGDEDKLRSQYMNHPTYKAMAEINQAYQGIAGNPGDTGPAQQAMVYQFSKILDPGSVVRETEYATAAANAGRINQARQYLTSLQSGKMLTPEQVALMKEVARNLTESGRGVLDQHNQLYSELSKRKGVDPANVVIDPFYKSKSSKVDVGAVDGGYRFKGGDPSKPENWEQVK